MIVNYNSGEYLVGAVESLRAQDFREGELEILVIEMNSPRDQSAALAVAEAGGATVLRLTENSGYSGGCNRGLAEARGEIVIFMNADIVTRPGSLRTLADFLDANRDVGLVEPRSYIDDEQTFLCSEHFPFSFAEPFSTALTRLSGRAAFALSKRTVAKRAKSWRSTEARDQKLLAGAFLAGRRETLQELGGFDETFRLYYEDWDLCLRVVSAGYRLVRLPQAVIVHYTHRSSLTAWEASMEKARQSRIIYLEKHHGRALRWLDAGLERTMNLLVRLPLPRYSIPFQDLGELSASRTLNIAGPDGPFLLEIAREPDFQTSCAHLGWGSAFTLKKNTLQGIPPGEKFFLRAVDTDPFVLRGAWTLRTAL